MLQEQLVPLSLKARLPENFGTLVFQSVNMLEMDNLIPFSLMVVLCILGSSAQGVGDSLMSLPCGLPLPGEDVVGENIWSVADTPDNEACYGECMDHPYCIAAVRVDATGACFLKEVDIFKGEVVPVEGLTSLIRCDFSATEGPEALAPGAVPESICDTPLRGRDIPGDILTSLGETPDLNSCIAACEATPPCNAAIRVDGNGGCFMKSVDVDAVEPVEVFGLTSSLICAPSA